MEIVQISIYFFIELSTKSTKTVGRLLILICMIPKLKLGVGKMRFMICDVHVSLNPSSWDINSMNLPCLTLVLPGNTSDSRNSSFFVVAPIVCEGGSFCYLAWMRELVALLLVFLLLCVMCVFLCFIVLSLPIVHWAVL